jgi:hypothetical protein
MVGLSAWLQQKSEEINIFVHLADETLHPLDLKKLESRELDCTAID